MKSSALGATYVTLLRGAGLLQLVPFTLKTFLCNSKFIFLYV